MKFLRTRCFILLLCAAAVSRSAPPPPPNLDNLLVNSPFGGQLGQKPGAKADAPLEFRGVLVEGGEVFFSLFEASSRISRWVGLKEPGNPFTVQGYSEEKGTVTLEYQGRTMILQMAEARMRTQLSDGPVPKVVAASVSPTEGLTITSLATRQRMREEMLAKIRKREKSSSPAAGSGVQTP